MRVLVTGASGFIGRHVVAELVRRGHHPVCLTKGPCPNGRKATWIQADLTRPSTYRLALPGVEAVIHAAAPSSAAWGGAPSRERGEAEAAVALLGEARRAGVERFICLSALGAAHDSPFEALRAKAALEEAVRQHWPHSGWLIRASLVFGKNDRFSSVLERRLVALGVALQPSGGRLRAQPLFVKDLAEGMVNLVEKDSPGLQQLDAVGPDVLELHELLELIAAADGRLPRRVRLPEPLVVGVLTLLSGGRSGLHRLVVPLLRTAPQTAGGSFAHVAGLSRLRPFGAAVRTYVGNP